MSISPLTPLGVGSAYAELEGLEEFYIRYKLKKLYGIFYFSSRNINFAFYRKTKINMYIIVDANIYLAAILNEPEKQTIIECTRGIELISPEVLPYEIQNS